MTLLIVGASGQLAQELRRSPAPPLPIRFAGRTEIDLSDPERAAAAIRSLAPAAVLNAAAYTAVDKAEAEEDLAERVNGLSPGRMAATCADLGIPFLHVSTDYVFDGASPKPYVETDQIAPLGAYGRTKALGESAVLSSGARVAVVRTAWLFSPFGANFVKTMLRLAETKSSIGVVADQHGRPTHAADLAAACLALIDRLVRGDAQAEGLFHFAGEDDAVWADVASAVFDASRALGGPFAAVNRIATSDYPTPARRPANSRLDTGKIRGLGINPQPWRPRVAACVSEILRP